VEDDDAVLDVGAVDDVVDDDVVDTGTPTHRPSPLHWSPIVDASRSSHGRPDGWRPHPSGSHR
jgi:hypothetical protein